MCVFKQDELDKNNDLCCNQPVFKKSLFVSPVNFCHAVSFGKPMEPDLGSMTAVSLNAIRDFILLVSASGDN